MSSTAPQAPSRDRRRTRRWWSAAGILGIACLGAGAVIVPQAAEHWEDLTETPQIAAAAPASPSAAPVSTLDPDAAQPGSEAVASALRTAQRDFRGGSLTAQVADARTGDVLYSDDAAKPVMPASNLKLLTAYTLLSHQDPSARYETGAYLGADGRSVVLRAGGDTMLSPDEARQGVDGRASLRDLARQTVDSLHHRGVTGTVPVRLDASRFTGPAVSPAWSAEDVASGYVTGVHPIALWDHHTQEPADPEETSHRPDDAAQDAVAAYLRELDAAGSAHGLSFTDAGAADAQDREASQRLGAVESATVLEQTRYMLDESDNVLAEVLGRNAAVAAGKEGSQEAAIALVRETLTRDGIGVEGLEQADLCGLSDRNRVTPATLVQTVQHAVTADDARAQLVSALPTAGLDGTLAARFEAADEAAGRGYVRAKTGTLLKVSSLSGVTTTEDGRLLVYSFVVNDLTDLTAAKDMLDRSAAALTRL
ncbi:D-alanyl-D-alanine carboxypeptidase/D-alanyl-D-alanine endopeptidase [Rothia kristinae]|uniref:D-alanyl-D-alanine carboxypeptidase/D-alanyl-D-alanine endopeptidase n=1 Tax=Rothia kristinae TaxID=37923 RepID=UPI0033C74304